MEGCEDGIKRSRGERNRMEVMSGRRDEILAQQITVTAASHSLAPASERERLTRNGRSRTRSDFPATPLLFLFLMPHVAYFRLLA